MVMLQSLRRVVRDYLARRLGCPDAGLSLTRLAGFNFCPSLIFDVGAFQGDFARLCHRFWPLSEVACFEVLPHKISELQKLSLNDPKMKVFPYLLGSKRKDKVIFHEAETASSVLEENISKDFIQRAYPMETIDHMVAQYYFGEIPDLIKIDTQGYELEILKGAEETLKRGRVVLAELNLIDIHKDVPLAGEVIEWLGCRGWVMYDVCEFHRRPLDQALWQMDIIFVKKEDPLRLDKRW